MNGTNESEANAAAADRLDGVVMRDSYLPTVGHSIVARRKVKSSIYANTIIGPVVETWENACRVVTNAGSIIEGEFRLAFNQWDFQYLHDSDEVRDEDPPDCDLKGCGDHSQGRCDNPDCSSRGGA